MDLSAIKQQVMFQIGGDGEDIQDFLPFLTRYVNDGYDRLALAAYGRHVGSGEGDVEPLLHDKSQPVLPEWTHPAIADYATWLICRNGSSQRQNRGYAFRRAFDTVESRLRMARGGSCIHRVPK